MRHEYPTKVELDRMGETLQRDIRLCSDELSAWFGRPHTTTIRTQAEKPAPKRIVVWPRRHKSGKRIA
jgi:hypothetical protein